MNEQLALGMFRSAARRRTACLQAAVKRISAPPAPESQYLPQENLPDTLSFEFRNDCDLYYLHKVVCSTIHYQGLEVPKLQASLEEARLRHQLARGPNELQEYQEQVEQLQFKIDLYGDPTRMSSYLRAADALLAQYKAIPGSNSQLDIMRHSSEVYYPTEVDLQRIGVIVKFIELARDIISIDYRCTGYVSYDPRCICLGCQSDLTAVSSSDEHYVNCPHCGVDNPRKHRHGPRPYQQAASSSGAGPEGARRSTPRKKRTNRGYEDISNFMKAFYRYACAMKPKDLDMDKLTADLDLYFQRENRPVGREVKERLPLNSQGQRLGTSVYTMVNALEATGYSKYYNDVYYICVFYWGWKAPEVMHLKDIVESDYQKTQQVWNEMSESERGRKSSISAPYRLFKHLQMRGHLCYATDFKMPSPDSVQNYERLWKIMTERCQDPDIYFIKT